MSNEVSDQEIEREIQTLRNLRRRSISSPGPGALAVDPDLPPSSPTSSASPTYTSNDDITLSTPDGLDGGDNAGLFWVPAHLHPELAPGEFRAFLKAHTHADPEHPSPEEAAEAGDEPSGLARSQSWLSRSNSRKEGLGRKRSMLSKQYHPSASDGVGEERPPMPTQRATSIYGGRSGEKGLTLQDLQKLETLVDEADRTGDPTMMRTMLRRSLSQNVAPGFLAETTAEGGASGLSRPSSILRRSARTKIRKANLPGDGGGHRFAASRKGRTTAAPDIEIPEDDYDYDGRRHNSDPSDESADLDNADAETFYDANQHIDSYVDGSDGGGDRRGSDASTDEAVIFDAYARQSRSSSMSSESISYEGGASIEESPSPPDQTPSLSIVTPTAPGPSEWYTDEGERTPTQERMTNPMGEMRRTTSGPLPLPQQDDRRSPSPTAQSTPPVRSQTLPLTGLPPGMAPPQQRLSIPAQPVQQTPPVVSAHPPSHTFDSRPLSQRVEAVKEKEKEKEKEKKGGFFSKKDKKDKDKEKTKKEKDGFLGSLFGGKKKVEEPSPISNFSADGRAAAAALLGSSKSAKSMGVQPTTSSSGTSPTTPGFSNFSRYPIHVERAIYRLSHIKLANARRPLFEQVLISNLMFWYLGIIGRNVQEEKKPGSTNGKGDEEKEQKVVVKGTPPRPTDMGSAGTPTPYDPPTPSRSPPPPQPSPSSSSSSSSMSSPAPKKLGLTKPERSRGGRDNEAPVRTPQYGQQNAQVEHEVRTATAQVQGINLKGSRSSQVPPPPQPTRDYPQSQAYPQSHGQGQGQGQGGPPQPQRSVSQSSSTSSQSSTSHSTTGTGRTLSPPIHQQAPSGRPISATYPAPPQQIPNQPRGIPQSSFGPPPPQPNGNSSGPGPISPFADRPDPRQRTMSQPGPGYAPNQVPPGVSGSMRRVVTDGRPPDPRAHPNAPLPQGLAPPSFGPQPGQLFQHPGGLARPPLGPGGSSGSFPPRSPVSPPPQPGQIFAQPGQVYHPHGPPPSGMSGSPQPGQVFQRSAPPPMSGQPQQRGPLPPQMRPPHPLPQPIQRLPPGASDPHWVAQQQQQHQHHSQQQTHGPGPIPPQFTTAPPPHLQQQQQQQYLARPPSQPSQSRSPPPPQHLQHPQQHPQYQQQPPQHLPRSPSFPGQNHSGPPRLATPVAGSGSPAPQPGQLFSPPQQQQQQQQHGYPAPGQDGYRRQQPIPPAQYGHHR